MLKKDPKIQQMLLELDIDLRTRWLWPTIEMHEKQGTLNVNTVALLVRAAYGQGYVDAQKEEFGKLQVDNGYTPPKPIDAKD